MDTNKLIETLTHLEIKILPLISKHPFLKDIAENTGLREVEVMRALQWLKNKSIVNIDSVDTKIIELDINGKDYLKKGLPEVRFIKSVKKATPLNKILSLAKLDTGELNVCLGILKGKSAITIKDRKVSVTSKGKQMLKQGFVEEKFLNKLSKSPVALSDLNKKEKETYESLRKRKLIIKTSLQKQKKAELTSIGKTISKRKLSTDGLVDRLNSKIIISGSWKGKKFRRYDVKAEVPKIFAGKKQMYRRFIDSVKERFVALGFREMEGPIVESDFWDMDALYMPQFHSARDIHEAYYVKEPKFAELDEKILRKVKAAHENGGDTGSKGWRYKFDVERTKRNLLRTQTTACSARTLASKNLDIPSKYFAISRCFRYDVIDATHLPDFNQVEGIVVEEGLTLRHLFGLLKMFAKEFAETDEIKIVPGYFPFTEPSCELFAKHPKLGWIELGGAGIFRPELTKPLGVTRPVLAWGLGIDRIAMLKLGINDIRHLFSHDLEFLRKTKSV